MKYLLLVTIKPTAPIDPAMLLSHKDWGHRSAHTAAVVIRAF
jgi:hypothetical protein